MRERLQRDRLNRLKAKRAATVKELKRDVEVGNCAR